MMTNFFIKLNGFNIMTGVYVIFVFITILTNLFNNIFVYFYRIFLFMIFNFKIITSFSLCCL